MWELPDSNPGPLRPAPEVWCASNEPPPHLKMFNVLIVFVPVPTVSQKNSSEFFFLISGKVYRYHLQGIEEFLH